MNNIRYDPIGLNRFASFDPSISRMRIVAGQHQPCAYCAMVYCLRHNDYKAAQLILKRMNSKC